MNWLIFFIGVLVGWLIELLIDFFFWRRRRAEPVASLDTRAELAGVEAKAGQLEARLVGVQDEQTRCMSELQTCRDDLACARDDLARAREELAAKAAEAQQLQASLADVNVRMPEGAFSFAVPGAVTRNNLQRIEGIGPKIVEILNANGISTFAELAEADVSRLREILKEAGPRYKLANPETWTEQARLAANGDWENLSELQNRLKGGRHKPQSQ